MSANAQLTTGNDAADSSLLTESLVRELSPAHLMRAYNETVQMSRTLKEYVKHLTRELADLKRRHAALRLDDNVGERQGNVACERQDDITGERQGDIAGEMPDDIDGDEEVAWRGHMQVEQPVDQESMTRSSQSVADDGSVDTRSGTILVSPEQCTSLQTIPPDDACTKVNSQDWAEIQKQVMELEDTNARLKRQMEELENKSAEQASQLELKSADIESLQKQLSEVCEARRSREAESEKHRLELERTKHSLDVATQSLTNLRREHIVLVRQWDDSAAKTAGATQSLMLMYQQMTKMVSEKTAILSREWQAKEGALRAEVNRSKESNHQLRGQLSAQASTIEEYRKTNERLQTQLHEQKYKKVEAQAKEIASLKKKLEQQATTSPVALSQQQDEERYANENKLVSLNNEIAKLQTENDSFRLKQAEMEASLRISKEPTDNQPASADNAAEILHLKKALDQKILENDLLKSSHSSLSKLVSSSTKNKINEPQAMPSNVTEPWETSVNKTSKLNPYLEPQVAGAGSVVQLQSLLETKQRALEEEQRQRKELQVKYSSLVKDFENSRRPDDTRRRNTPSPIATRSENVAAGSPSCAGASAAATAQAGQAENSRRQQHREGGTRLLSGPQPEPMLQCPNCLDSMPDYDSLKVHSSRCDT